MDYSVGLAQSQRVIKQRNMLGIVALVLAGLVVLLFLVGATRDREIVLQPIVRTPLTLSSSGVSRDSRSLSSRRLPLARSCHQRRSPRLGMRKSRSPATKRRPSYPTA